MAPLTIKSVIKPSKNVVDKIKAILSRIQKLTPRSMKYHRLRIQLAHLQLQQAERERDLERIDNNYVTTIDEYFKEILLYPETAKFYLFKERTKHIYVIVDYGYIVHFHQHLTEVTDIDEVTGLVYTYHKHPSKKEQLAHFQSCIGKLGSCIDKSSPLSVFSLRDLPIDEVYHRVYWPTRETKNVVEEEEKPKMCLERLGEVKIEDFC